MKLLLSNDDGIDAPGLAALLAAARGFGEPVVVAPAGPQSGVSHMITWEKGVRLEPRGTGAFAVHGTPADCARLGLLRVAPETAWVLSGINHGGNLGADVYYSGTVAALRRLELADNMLGAAAVERLVHSTRLPKLHRLGLSGNRLWSYQRDTLPDRTALLRVPILDLRNNGLTADGLSVMLMAADADVRELDLSHNRLRDEGAVLLAAADVLRGLRVLKLAANDVTDDGLRALAASPHLSRLAALDVSNNPVGDDGVRAIVESRHLTALRQFVYPNLGLSFRLRVALRARYAE